jgi:general secretion pathway protein I
MRRGFTLLEMLMATLVMGIAVVGLLSGLSGATRNAARLMDHDRAVLLARAKMNELIAAADLPAGREYGGLYDPRESGGLEAGWRARIAVWARPGTVQGFFLLDRIELEVWWKRGEDRRNFFLEGFRTRRALRDDFPPAEPAP